jgi:WD40 repeat protein
MKSPFKFLDSYTKDDREIFFGRDEEIEELYQKVFESKLLLVYGVSGTGKSSLIHCGLANKFLETDWLPLVIRRGGNIIESMASGIKAASITQQDNKFISSGDFKKSVRSLYLDHYKPVFFIFDQFEELFIFGDKEERKQFVQIVKALIESDIQCRLIFVMREEYMAGVTEFERYIPTFFANRVRIEKISHANALEAIIKPCEVFNISLEDGFAESLLERLCPGSTDVELTYLQVFLDKIFRLAVEEKELQKDQEQLSFSLSHLYKIGNVSDLLGSFLDEQISLLPDPDTVLAVLKSFVSIKGTKRQMKFKDAKEYALILGRPVKDSLLTELLQTFINLRILHDKDKNGKYELRHDSLAEKIFEKITLVEKDVLEIRQFIDNAYNNWKKRDVLISARDLDYIAPYKTRLYLPAELDNLIERSKNELLRTRNRRRNLAVFSGITLILVLSIFTTWALIERSKSVKLKTIAVANYFTSLSKEFINSDPTKALRLATYANKLNSTEENRRNLINIYSNNEFYNTFLPAKSMSISYLNNFRFLGRSGHIAIQDEGRIRMIHSDGEIINDVPVDHSGFSFEISPDERYMLINDHVDSVMIYNFEKKTFLKIKSKKNSIWRLNGPNEDQFFSDSKMFYTRSLFKEISVWSVTGDLIGRSDKLRQYSYILVPEASNKLLTCSNDGFLCTWDFKSNTITEIKLDINKDAYINNPVILPDSRIAVYRSDECICIYDSCGKCLKSWHIDYFPGKIIFIYDKDMILTKGDKTIDVWDLYGNNLSTIKVGTSISDITYDQWGKQVLFATDGRIISFKFGNQQNTIKLKSDQNVFFSSSLNKLVEFAVDEKKLNIFNIDGTPETNINLKGDLGFPYISKSGNYFAFGYETVPGITIIDLRTKSSIYIIRSEVQPSFISFSHNDELIATSGKITTDPTKHFVLETREFDFDLFTKNGKFLRKYYCDDMVNAVRFSDDNRFILSSAGSEAILWDTEGKKIHTFSGHADNISDLDISSDNNFIITGSFDGSARLWSADGRVLKIIHTGKTSSSTQVAFVRDKPLFLTSNENHINLYNMKGLLIQDIPVSGSLRGKQIFFSDDNSILYMDSKKEAMIKINIKMPVDSFILSNNYNDLSINEKLDYGIKSIKDLLSSDNYEDMYMAGLYLIREKMTQVMDPDEKKRILNNANELFRRGLISDPNPCRIYRRLTELYLQLYSLSNENINDKLDKFYASLASSNDSYDLYLSANLYSRLIEKNTLPLGFEVKSLAIYKKIIDLNQGQIKRVASDCSDLTFRLLLLKDFKIALDAAQTSIRADNDNPNIYTNLPLAYIFNDQYEKAIEIYTEWKDKPLTTVNNLKPYKDVFLEDIETLESKGITHPDFEKVKELLKK